MRIISDMEIGVLCETRHRSVFNRAANTQTNARRQSKLNEFIHSIIIGAGTATVAAKDEQSNKFDHVRFD